MTLQRIFQIKISQWEERMAATFFSTSLEFDPEMFEKEAARRIELAIRKLKDLPLSWGLQVSSNTLAQKETDASS